MADEHLFHMAVSNKETEGAWTAFFRT